MRESGRKIERIAEELFRLALARNDLAIVRKAIKVTIGVALVGNAIIVAIFTCAGIDVAPIGNSVSGVFRKELTIRLAVIWNPVAGLALNLAIDARAAGDI